MVPVLAVGNPPKRSVAERAEKRKRLRKSVCLLGYCVQSSSKVITRHSFSACSRIPLGLHKIAN
jgi:hypothetical protein